MYKKFPLKIYESTRESHNNNNNTTVISPFVFYVSLSYLITNPCISFPLDLMTVSHFL